MISGSILIQAEQLLDQGATLEEVAQAFSLDVTELSLAIKNFEGEGEEVTAEEAALAKKQFIDTIRFSPIEALKVRAAENIYANRPWVRRMKRRAGEGQVVVNIQAINNAILASEKLLKDAEGSSGEPDEVIDA